MRQVRVVVDFGNIECETDAGFYSRAIVEFDGKRLTRIQHDTGFLDNGKLQLKQSCPQCLAKIRKDNEKVPLIADFIASIGVD